LAAINTKVPDKRRIRFAVATLAMLGMLLILIASLQFSMNLVYASADVRSSLFELPEEPYWNMLGLYEEQGYQVTDTEIVIKAVDYSDTNSQTLEVIDELDGRQGEFLVWREDETWVDWTVEIPKSGLYSMNFTYYPIEGKRAPIRRSMKINGEYPFREARRFQFNRLFVDSAPPIQDNRGNDVQPTQVEIKRWMNTDLYDPDGLYLDPVLFYFEAGTHTIRLEALGEPIVLDTIVLGGLEQIPSYEQVLNEYRAKGYKEVDNVLVKFQAEDTYVKSDATLRREFGSDPLSEPFAAGQWRLNEFGGWRWRLGNQEVTWRFTVPETGFYKLSMRVYQDGHLPSIRSIRVDDQFLFEEMREVRFYRDKHWRVESFADEDGVPYLIPLEAGEHTLSMVVKAGEVSRTVHVFTSTIRRMAELGHRISMLVGRNPDPNMEWELEKRIPGLVDELQEIRDVLAAEVDFLTELAGGKRPIIANSILIVLEQLDQFLDKPDRMVMGLERFQGNQQSLGTWILELQEKPLRLDYIAFSGPDVPEPRGKSSTWERWSLSFFNFKDSFAKDYTGVGSYHDEGRVLEVWSLRGREWTQIIKEMAEETFTPETGIHVNMNVLPSNQTQVLLLASVAQQGPDIAMGVPPTMPVEFAIRNGLVDLSEFEDYEEVITRFRPGAMTPFQYRDGVYAIPENQDFSMMFYRTDILGMLDLEPPQTWEDVYKMIPTLHANRLDFYYAGGFMPFLYQRGGKYYTDDGLKSALDQPEALQAFKEYTDLYTSYRIPMEANFYMRMRSGEIPIGIAGYGVYTQLSVAAPEITGWWEMAPMPGHMKDGGVIDRSAGGSSQVAVIMRDCEDPEAAWEFLKWWTSAEVQARYGTELEALIGVEARWNTANVEALQSLPWPRRDIEAILEQWEWFQEIPVVLGGYYTDRHVNNAWNRVVLQGWNAMEALEEAVREINRELQRKQEEFGITSADDLLGDSK
jgi:ABC-type glycerol-3-phosphate transport system substrate-binding protein